MNKLSVKERAQILSCLVEGNSIRATCRMTGAAKGTVTKLLVDVGAACAAYQDKMLRNLRCKRVQVDEIWSFVYSKQKNVPEGMEGKAGDAWTWTAIDADTKLVPSFMVGPRSVTSANAFIGDLKTRLANRIQLTSDGHKVYADAIERVFAADIDYGILQKVYANPADAKHKHKYSSDIVVRADRESVCGSPDGKHISTSFVERQNLTMRMGMRRMTRLTNAFSKKMENLFFAVALHFMYYNFGRIHQTLRITPAMEAGVSDHVWSLEEIAGLAG